MEDNEDLKKIIEKLKIEKYKSNLMLNKIRPFFYFFGLLSFIIFLIENVQNLEYLKNSIPVFCIIGLSIFFGFLLFIYRENYRLGYGIIEIIVGLLAISSLYEISIDNSFADNLNLEVYVKLGGGLYVIVRGFDNIFKNIESKKIGIWLKEHYNIGKRTER